MGFFEPERYFARVSAINIQRDIIDKRYSHVLIDVDNTLLTRDDHTVPRDALIWFGKLREAGVKVCLLSNNFHIGVVHLAEKLEVPIVRKSH